MNQRMKEYIALFDIDGTILNLQKGIARNIFADTINKFYGIELIDEELPSFSGKTDLQILYDIANSFELSYIKILSKIDGIWEILYNEFSTKVSKETIELMPGVVELIDLFEQTSHFSIGLVTGNFKKNAYLKLGVVELHDKFSFGAFGCDHIERNELPKIAIIRAIEKNIITPNFEYRNAIIIGDTFRDILCAKANDMVSVAVETGSEDAESLKVFQPDFIFKDLSNPTDVFNSIINYLKY